MNRPARKAVIRLAIAAFAIFAPWAFTAFVVWEPNPGNWTAEARFGAVGLLLPLSAGFGAIFALCVGAGGGQ